MGAKYERAYVKADTIRSLQQVNEIILIDLCLCAMPSYPTLKIFQEYSQVK